MKSFGKRVAEVRKSKGVTQQQLAESIGMSVVAIALLTLKLVSVGLD